MDSERSPQILEARSAAASVIARNSGVLAESPKIFVECSLTDSASIGSIEKVLALRGPSRLPFQVLPNCSGEVRPHGDSPCGLAQATRELDGTIIEVDVVRGQPCYFADGSAGRVQRENCRSQGIVVYLVSWRPCQVRRIQQSANFFPCVDIRQKV